MDDFGAGHTSFRNLRDLAFDIVKIDGAFIRNVATSEDDRFFVRTLIDLAQPSVAEGRRRMGGGRSDRAYPARLGRRLSAGRAFRLRESAAGCGEAHRAVSVRNGKSFFWTGF